MKANYHSHTPRCMHAVGSEEEYVKAALEAGFGILGFSDHTPWPYLTGYRSGMRMTCDELDNYKSSIKQAREKYAGQIVIHTGLEAEYFPRYADHLRRMLDGGIEYLLLGQHSLDSDEEAPISWTAQLCVSDDMVLRYADIVTSAIRTGMFAYVAHPDIFMRRRTDGMFTKACERAASEIAQCAMEEDVPLEYNLLGLKCRHEGEAGGYPNPEFWQFLSRYPVKTVIGVDAHSPSQLLAADLWDEAEKALTDLGFQVIGRLPMDAEQ